MEADGNMTFAFIKKAFQLAAYAYRTDGDASRTPGKAVDCRKNLRRPQHIVEVVHRFALSHEHDVCQLVTFRKSVDLVEDVGSRQVSFESLLTRLAEQAVHLTAHLT